MARCLEDVDELSPMLCMKAPGDLELNDHSLLDQQIGSEEADFMAPE